jgi:6-pyruvoyl tetrahydropterin synthase/QueD family protein
MGTLYLRRKRVKGNHNVALTVKCTLSCAHKLLGCVAKDSKCRNLHGHTYYVSVDITGDGYWSDIIVDTNVVKKKIMDKFDHTYLNEVMSCETTVENLAREIRYLVAQVAKVRVLRVRVQEGDGAVVQVGYYAQEIQA